MYVSVIFVRFLMRGLVSRSMNIPDGDLTWRQMTCKILKIAIALGGYSSETFLRLVHFFRTHVHYA